MKPEVSIVVPVKNGMGTLERLIRGIQQQNIFDKIEVIAIDSGSTDGSKEYLEQLSFVDVVSIDPETFNHGATRNLAVSHCNGDYIFMTVQDAWMEDPELVSRMLSHFENKEVMGVCGGQTVPHIEGTNPHQWYRPQSKPMVEEVHFGTADDFHMLSPKQKRAYCGWDDVVAMYRKTALEIMPFERVVFGEDMLWAKMAVERGYKLVYDSGCRVNHYHYQFPIYTFKRTLISKLFIYKCFGLLDNRTASIKDYLIIIYRNIKWRLHIRWIAHNFQILFQTSRAIKILEKHMKNDTIDLLEEELSLSIPVGNQKINKQ